MNQPLECKDKDNSQEVYGCISYTSF